MRGPNHLFSEFSDHLALGIGRHVLDARFCSYAAPTNAGIGERSRSGKGNTKLENWEVNELAPLHYWSVLFLGKL